MPESKKARVNIRSVANTAMAREETRNNRKVMVVPSATLPDDIVMNGVKYPAPEIEGSFKSLERTPAPLGHPMANGMFVSARDPEGINLGWIGAHNENLRRDNGRVFMDKVIDIEVANRSEGGKAVLAAINAGDPIHTSTGLYCTLEEAGQGDGYDYIARDIEFDHDAILLNEEGAATPDQGVGMMVNSATGEKFTVVNSVIADDAMRDLEWATDMAVRAVERMERASMIDRIKSAILEAIKGSDGGETSANEGEADMADEKQFNELSKKVNAIEEAVGGIGEQIANAVKEAVKPLTDNLAEMQANQKAKDDAEHAELVNKVTKANLLDEDTAKATPLATLKALANKAEPGKAAALNGALGNTADDDFSGVDLNDLTKGKEG